MILLSLLVLAQTSMPARGAIEWVVREVIPGGASPYPGFERRWLAAKAPSDVDGDGRSDFVLLYEDHSLAGGYPWFGLLSARNNSNDLVEVRRDRYGTSYSYESPFADMAILNSPLGVLQAIPHLNNGWRHSTIKASGAIVAEGPRQYQNVYRIPDLDGDGYEDIFAQALVNNYAYSALLDGRTMTEQWGSMSGYNPGHCQLSPYGTKSFVDVNADGVPDFFSAFPVWNGSAIEGEFRMLSGVDGSVIWGWSELQYSGNISAAIVPDVTGDGVMEFAITTSGPWMNPAIHFQLLDGSSGAVIWARYPSRLQLDPPQAGLGMNELNNPILATDNPLNPGAIQVAIQCRLDSLSGGRDPNRFLHMELRTGQVLGWAEEPFDLMPWYPDLLDTIAYNLRFPLGDMDRDGLTEVALPCFGFSTDVPGNLIYPWHMAIIGLRTLYQPATAMPGEQIDYRITIPGASNHDYSLLLSLGFDRDGGALVDGQKTHLVADAAFQATLAGRYTGRLDARGGGVQRVTLPSNPALSGKTLYAKAVVWKPGGAGEIWTMSSLGITEIR